MAPSIAFYHVYALYVPRTALYMNFIIDVLTIHGIN